MKTFKTFINLTRGDPMELENFFKSKEFKNIQKLNSFELYPDSII